MSRTQPNNPTKLSLAPFGARLTAALGALYVVCALAALVAPGLQLSHAWLTLFSTTPLSAPGLIEGVLGNVVFAWFAAAAFVPTYNAMEEFIA